MGDFFLLHFLFHPLKRLKPRTENSRHRQSLWMQGTVIHFVAAISSTNHIKPISSLSPVAQTVSFSRWVGILLR